MTYKGSSRCEVWASVCSAHCPCGLDMELEGFSTMQPGFVSPQVVMFAWYVETHMMLCLVTFEQNNIFLIIVYLIPG